MTRALVTGADGFVGQHLVQLLLKSGYSVSGTFYTHQPKIDEIEWFQCNIRERDELDNLIQRLQPDHVYHLAALSSPGGSFAAERLVYDTNFWGTLNLLEAIRKFAPQSRVLYVGSAQCYGKPNELPITESHEFRPENPYAVSKAAADLLCYQYFYTHKLHVIRARPSNHTGEGQSADYVCSNFAKQAAAIELGLQEPEISVGNLDLERDFSHVSDVIAAYETLIGQGIPGEAYNVGGGEPMFIRNILEILTSFVSKNVRIHVDEGRVRSNELRSFYLDVQKLTSLGWQRSFELFDALHDLYNAWRNRLTSMQDDHEPYHNGQDGLWRRD